MLGPSLDRLAITFPSPQAYLEYWLAAPGAGRGLERLHRAVLLLRPGRAGPGAGLQRPPGRRLGRTPPASCAPGTWNRRWVIWPAPSSWCGPRWGCSARNCRRTPTRWWPPLRPASPSDRRAGTRRQPLHDLAYYPGRERRRGRDPQPPGHSPRRTPGTGMNWAMAAPAIPARPVPTRRPPPPTRLDTAITLGDGSSTGSAHTEPPLRRRWLDVGWDGDRADPGILSARGQTA